MLWQRGFTLVIRMPLGGYCDVPTSRLADNQAKRLRWPNISPRLRADLALRSLIHLHRQATHALSSAIASGADRCSRPRNPPLLRKYCCALAAPAIEVHSRATAEPHVPKMTLSRRKKIKARQRQARTKKGKTFPCRSAILNPDTARQTMVAMI
jgi:hypothetical protein